jgi:hypothetical protein
MGEEGGLLMLKASQLRLSTPPDLQHMVVMAFAFQHNLFHL